jgi:hypothetical protein
VVCQGRTFSRRSPARLPSSSDRPVCFRRSWRSRPPRVAVISVSRRSFELKASSRALRGSRSLSANQRERKRRLGGFCRVLFRICAEDPLPKRKRFGLFRPLQRVADLRLIDSAATTGRHKGLPSLSDKAAGPAEKEQRPAPSNRTFAQASAWRQKECFVGFRG